LTVVVNPTTIRSRPQQTLEFLQGTWYFKYVNELVYHILDKDSNQSTTFETSHVNYTIEVVSDILTNQAIVYVLKQIKSYDIIGLQETKCDIEKVDFSSYYIISIITIAIV
jgi:hypothetical protein